MRESLSFSREKFSKNSPAFSKFESRDNQTKSTIVLTINQAEIKDIDDNDKTKEGGAAVQNTNKAE
jgi:hypothetical protein